MARIGLQFFPSLRGHHLWDRHWVMALGTCKTNGCNNNMLIACVSSFYSVHRFQSASHYSRQAFRPNTKNEILSQPKPAALCQANAAHIRLPQIFAGARFKATHSSAASEWNIMVFCGDCDFATVAKQRHSRVLFISNATHANSQYATRNGRRCRHFYSFPMCLRLDSDRWKKTCEIWRRTCPSIFIIQTPDEVFHSIKCELRRVLKMDNKTDNLASFSLNVFFFSLSELLAIFIALFCC